LQALALAFCPQALAQQVLQSCAFGPAGFGFAKTNAQADRLNPAVNLVNVLDNSAKALALQFGTFQREEEKVVYGLTRNINTNNPLSINFSEFKLLWRDIKKCRNFRDKLKVCFGGLSYRPSYFDQEEPQSKKEM